MDKFKPKKTTDDCYTPPLVYDAVKMYCIETYGIKAENIIRPFYPGGDYEHYQYKSTDVVVDNPPFSIISKICYFYQKNNIQFFLFSPYLTNFSGARKVEMTHIITSSAIIYENGANVNTCFLTNMENTYRCRTDLKLHKMINDAIDCGKKTVELPKYRYDRHILTATMLGYMCSHGVEFRVKNEDCAYVSVLDRQKEMGKAIFGGGFILSEKAAAEKAAAEKVKAITWELSEREKEIVKSLGI